MRRYARGKMQTRDTAAVWVLCHTVARWARIRRVAVTLALRHAVHCKIYKTIKEMKHRSRQLDAIEGRGAAEK